MSTALSQPLASLQPSRPATDLEQLMRRRIEAALARLAPGSRRQYERAFRLFASWAAEHDHQLLEMRSGTNWWELLISLLQAGPLTSATLVETYLAEGCQGKAPATVAQRLAAIKWAFRLAREAGIILWDLHVRAPKVQVYRDTRGPSIEALRLLLRQAESLPDPFRERDSLLLGLLFVLGLRRGEIATLRMVDVDLEGRTLMVLGKGSQERLPITMPALLVEAVERYLPARPNDAPEDHLLLSLDPAGRGSGGLTASGIYRRVQRLARLAGLSGRVTPHGLRHAAITAALDSLNGDLRRVRVFARHAKADTTIVYDDRRRDVGGEVAAVLAELVALAPASTSDSPTSPQ